MMIINSHQGGPLALPSSPLKQNDFSKTKIKTTWWACTYCCVALILDYFFNDKLSSDEIIKLITFNTSKLKHVSSGVDNEVITDALIEYGIDPFKIETIDFKYNNYIRNEVEVLLSNKVSIFLQENHAVVLISISEKFFLMDPDDHTNHYQEVEMDEFIFESIRNDGTVSMIVISP